MEELLQSKECKELLEKWEHGARILHIGHHLAAANRDSIGRSLGIIVVVLSAVISSGIFASMKENDNITLKYIIGGISLISVALASVSNFIKYSDKAEKHRIAASGYGELRNEIQLQIYCKNALCKDCQSRCDQMDSIKKKWVELELKNITLPQKFHDKAKKITLGK